MSAIAAPRCLPRRAPPDHDNASDSIAPPLFEVYWPNVADFGNPRVPMHRDDQGSGYLRGRDSQAPGLRSASAAAFACSAVTGSDPRPKLLDGARRNRLPYRTTEPRVVRGGRAEAGLVSLCVRPDSLAPLELSWSLDNRMLSRAAGHQQLRCVTGGVGLYARRGR